ncbi:MAG: hypothetical protein ABFR97_08950 [Thermodesulfobacteriota bacterium]
MPSQPEEKFIADIDNQVREANEGNNQGYLNFSVAKPMNMTSKVSPLASSTTASNMASNIDPNRLKIAFQIIPKSLSLYNYNFPTTSYLTLHMSTTKRIDPSTVQGKKSHHNWPMPRILAKGGER